MFVKENPLGQQVAFSDQHRNQVKTPNNWVQDSLYVITTTVNLPATNLYDSTFPSFIYSPENKQNVKCFKNGKCFKNKLLSYQHGLLSWQTFVPHTSLHHPLIGFLSGAGDSLNLPQSSLRIPYPKNRINPPPGPTPDSTDSALY